MRTMPSSSTGCTPTAWPAPAAIDTIAGSFTVGAATRSWTSAAATATGSSTSSPARPRAPAPRTDPDPPRPHPTSPEGRGDRMTDRDPSGDKARRGPRPGRRATGNCRTRTSSARGRTKTTGSASARPSGRSCRSTRRGSSSWRAPRSTASTEEPAERLWAPTYCGSAVPDRRRRRAIGGMVVCRPLRAGESWVTPLLSTPSGGRQGLPDHRPDG